MSKEDWFRVDGKGFADNQGYRESYTFPRELIANSFDEKENGATQCTVSLESAFERSGGENKGVWLRVEDDGPGFKRQKDIFTLFGETEKRNNPNQRGRFNSGEKEAIAVSREAIVETVGLTVVFDETGRREKKNDRTGGTKISLRMPWKKSEIPEIADMLALFIPPDNFKYSVSVISDGQEEVKVVERPKLLATAAESLPTVIDADGEGLKKADRRTEIQVYESTDGTGRLFEMGVPVQPIDAPYSVSVEQKVPLDPNRNMVRPAFLERIYAIVLNSVHEQMNGEAMAETWVSKAVQNNLSNEEARKSVKEKKFGRTLLRSSDPWANAEAIEHGFNVIDSRLVPPKERENLQALGLRPAGQVFSRKSAPGTDIPRSEWTEGMLAAESLAHWIGRIWGIEPIVSFFTSKATCAAQYCPAEHSLEYNLSRCGGKSFFALPLSWEVLRLTLHEIAHEKGDWHDAAYRQGMEELAAKLMLRVLEQPAEFREIVH